MTDQAPPPIPYADRDGLAGELACVVGFWKMYNSIHESLGVPIEATLLAQGGSG